MLKKELRVGNFKDIVETDWVYTWTESVSFNVPEKWEHILQVVRRLKLGNLLPCYEWRRQKLTFLSRKGAYRKHQKFSQKTDCDPGTWSEREFKIHIQDTWPWRGKHWIVFTFQFSRIVTQLLKTSNLVINYKKRMGADKKKNKKKV